VQQRIDSLMERAEQALVAFLRTELELGLTYVSTAKRETGFDAAGAQRATRLAKDALETFRRFHHRLADPEIQTEFEARAIALEEGLSSLPGR
jgi:hypothetical protein